MRLIFIFGLLGCAVFIYALFAWDGLHLVNATRCHFMDGTYQKVGPGPDDRECVKIYFDGNVNCSSSYDCMGGCMVNSLYEKESGFCKPTTQTKGLCMYQIEDVRLGKASSCSQ